MHNTSIMSVCYFLPKMYTWLSIIQKSTSNGNRALGKFLEPRPSPGLVFMAQKCQNHQHLIVYMQVAFLVCATQPGQKLVFTQFHKAMRQSSALEVEANTTFSTCIFFRYDYIWNFKVSALWELFFYHLIMTLI